MLEWLSYTKVHPYAWKTLVVVGAVYDLRWTLPRYKSKLISLTTPSVPGAMLRLFSSIKYKNFPRSPFLTQLKGKMTMDTVSLYRVILSQSIYFKGMRLHWDADSAAPNLQSDSLPNVLLRQKINFNFLDIISSIL